MFHFDFFTLFFGFLPFVFALVVFGWILGIVSVGLIMATGQRILFISPLIALVMQPFSCVFYSREVLPGILKTFSYLIPASYVFENMRAILLNNSSSMVGLMVAFLLNGLYLYFAIVFVRVAISYGKKKGKFIEI